MPTTSAIRLAIMSAPMKYM